VTAPTSASTTSRQPCATAAKCRRRCRLPELEPRSKTVLEKKIKTFDQGVIHAGEYEYDWAPFLYWKKYFFLSTKHAIIIRRSIVLNLPLHLEFSYSIFPSLSLGLVLVLSWSCLDLVLVLSRSCLGLVSVSCQSHTSLLSALSLSRFTPVSVFILVYLISFQSRSKLDLVSISSNLSLVPRVRWCYVDGHYVDGRNVDCCQCRIHMNRALNVDRL